MILTAIDDPFVAHLSMGNIINKCPADATTFSCINETILWTGVERILPFYELRMQHNITLLTECRKILQTFPMNEVFGACDTS